jgi:GH25 family lysozyme M1 (1,4-beta-N-acetylmuramidase)
MVNNPETPPGYRLMSQNAVTTAMTAWAVQILQSPEEYPMSATATRVFGARQVLARVEWHPPDFQNHVEHRGVTLYEGSLGTIDATPARGIDISRYQLDVDFKQAQASGVSFAFIKATESIALADAAFAAHWSQAKQVGLLRGAYHFFRPQQDAIAQARLFLAQLSDPGELPPTLDIEVTDGVPGNVLVAGASAWVDYVTARLCRPLIYTSPGFWNALPGTASLALKTDLWVAHWGATEPADVNGWLRCMFWQRTNQASVPGIHNPVDEDRFNGSLAQLRAFSAAVFAERQTLGISRTTQLNV